MTRTIRRLLVLLTGTLGLAVATASPALAGFSLQNHSEPFGRTTSPKTGALQ